MYVYAKHGRIENNHLGIFVSLHPDPFTYSYFVDESSSGLTVGPLPKNSQNPPETVVAAKIKPPLTTSYKIANCDCFVLKPYFILAR